jgi:hypothetical protein
MEIKYKHRQSIKQLAVIVIHGAISSADGYYGYK